MALLAAVLLLANAALAASPSSPADLDGSWLGRMGCTTGAYRMSLRVIPRQKGPRRLFYSLQALDGRERASGAGALEEDGALSLERPAGIPLLPRTLPAKLDFSRDLPRFKGWTLLGVLEPLAGAKTDCGLREKTASLDCLVEWHLGGEAGRCRMRLLDQAVKGAKDTGALPCPPGTRYARSGGRLLCAAPARVAAVKKAVGPCGEGRRKAPPDRGCLPYVCVDGEDLPGAKPYNGACPNGTHEHPNERDPLRAPKVCVGDYNGFKLKGAAACERCQDPSHAKVRLKKPKV